LRRRTVLGLSCAFLAAPLLARAQAKKVYRLGWLSTGESEVVMKRLLENRYQPALRDLGYESGRNLEVHVRFSMGQVSRLPALAKELIALKPDILLGAEAACGAMARQTSTIPIVITASNDPVSSGLVQSLARPGTNVTGMTHLTLTAKHVELLSELAPKLSRVVLINDASYYDGRFDRLAREAAAARKLELLIIYATATPEGIREAFARASKLRDAGIVVVSTAPFSFLHNTIVQEVSRSRMPAVYPHAHYVSAGGLISYGANLDESFRREIAPIVDRILKGAKPAEIPVQQSRAFELVVNMKAAREIGLTIPQTVLLRADRVIE
jgi:putative ABC transport system substrate-binding protein